MVGGCPLSDQELQGASAQETGSKASLEWRGVTTDPNACQPREFQDARVEEAEVDSELEYQDSREELPGSLVASITVHQLAPATQPMLTIPDLSAHTSQNPESVPLAAHQQQDIEDTGELDDIPMGDLLEDTKVYQDTAFEYKSAYDALCLQQEELQTRFTQQAQLIEEASGALRAVETESSQRYTEIVNLKKIGMLIFSMPSIKLWHSTSFNLVQQRAACSRKNVLFRSCRIRCIHWNYL